MANIYYDFYNGSDHYSDGDEIENRIYDMVKSGLTDDGSVLQTHSYPVIYHLSYLRENILNWYPFRKQARILEIGAGCGALTGLYCDRAEHVTAVELSKRRGEINFIRHQDKENLDIYIGNLNDMTFPDQFDYIVLTGVLEYAIQFTKSKNPYMDFLNRLKKYLKVDGKLLIAIENRFGLKYFSGAREDHTGRFFSGLNGYTDTNSVRTFTKSEITALLNVSGFPYQHFYYPFPDYKFPGEILTDQSLSRYGKKYFSIDSERFSLFHEQPVAQSLVKEGVAASFVNSFLIEAGFMDTSEPIRIEYVKLSNNRDEKFRIATIIQTVNDRKSVIKVPLDPKAKDHLQTIVQNSEMRYPGKIICLKNELEGNQVFCDYINEKTLNDLIGEACEQGDKEKIIQLFSGYTSIAYSETKLTDDFQSEQFCKLFGDSSVQDKHKFHCVRPANIDTLCENIFVQNERYLLIDCEWVFDFYIPCEFIIWRMIHQLYSNHPKLQSVFPIREFFELYGINKESIKIFIQWSNFFSHHFVKNDALEQIRKQTIPLDLDCFYENLKKKDVLSSKLYVDTGLGFTEDRTIKNEIRLKKDGLFEVEYDISAYSDVKQIRWDPVEMAAFECKIDRLGGACILYTNAYSVEDHTFTFTEPDAVFVLEPENGKITVKGSFRYLTERELLLLLKAEQQNSNAKIAELNEAIENRQKQIEDLCNTIKSEQIKTTNLDGELKSEQIKTTNLDGELKSEQKILANLNCILLEEQKKTEEIMIQYQTLQQEYNRIVYSAFWKATKPLRLLSQRLKKPKE